jgi:hypothetical protein
MNEERVRSREEEVSEKLKDQIKVSYRALVHRIVFTHV